MFATERASRSTYDAKVMREAKSRIPLRSQLTEIRRAVVHRGLLQVRRKRKNDGLLTLQGTNSSAC